jgi:hypothetical protein
MGASLPPTGSFPSSLGAPKFATMAFRLAMDFATRGSACALAVLGISIDAARKQPVATISTRKLFLFTSRLLAMNGRALNTKCFEAH